MSGERLRRNGEPATAAEWFVAIESSAPDDVTAASFAAWLDRAAEHEQELERCDAAAEIARSLADDPELRWAFDEAAALAKRDRAAVQSALPLRTLRRFGWVAALAAAGLTAAAALWLVRDARSPAHAPATNPVVLRQARLRSTRRRLPSAARASRPRPLPIRSHACRAAASSTRARSPCCRSARHPTSRVPRAYSPPRCRAISARRSPRCRGSTSSAHRAPPPISPPSSTRPSWASSSACAASSSASSPSTTAGFASPQTCSTPRPTSGFGTRVRASGRGARLAAEIGDAITAALIDPNLARAAGRRPPRCTRGQSRDVRPTGFALQ